MNNSQIALKRRRLTMGTQQDRTSEQIIDIFRDIFSFYKTQVTNTLDKGNVT